MARSAVSPENRWAKWLQSLNSTKTRRGALENLDEELTDWCVETSKTLLMLKLSCEVRVFWNPKMRSTAGRAWWPDCSIDLNPKLKDCGQEELWRTLKHELAHLVAYERSLGRRIEPHGKEWQAACRELGIPGERVCHDLPFKRREMTRKHAYICQNCGAITRRVRPIKVAVACYHCCKTLNGGKFDVRFRLKSHPL